MEEVLLHTFRRVESRHWWFRARRALLTSMLSRWVPSGASVLDVGCGTGYFLEAVAERYHAYGVDPSPTAVGYCHDRGLDRVAHGSTDDLSAFVGVDFDAVTLLDVLEHCDDPVAALATATGILAPGGIILVSVPAYTWLWSPHDDVNEHRRRYSRRLLMEQIAAAGLTPLFGSYFNTVLFPIAAPLRVAQRALHIPHRGRLVVPPPLLNRALEKIFSVEIPVLAGAQPRQLPFGLSVVAVARR